MYNMAASNNKFFSNFEVEIYSLNSVFGNLGISANEK